MVPAHDIRIERSSNIPSLVLSRTKRNANFLPPSSPMCACVTVETAMTDDLNNSFASETAEGR